MTSYDLSVGQKSEPLQQGRSQKLVFFWGGYNFFPTQYYSPIYWRHRLQLVHKIIFMDWYWGYIYRYIPRRPCFETGFSTNCDKNQRQYHVVLHKDIIFRLWLNVLLINYSVYGVIVEPRWDRRKKRKGNKTVIENLRKNTVGCQEDVEVVSC